MAKRRNPARREGWLYQVLVVIGLELEIENKEVLVIAFLEEKVIFRDS